MDICSTLVTALVGILTLLVLYVIYMSRHYSIFKSVGVKSLSPWPAVGNFLQISKIGYLEFHRMLYKKFTDEKAYGYFEGSTPVLVVKDLDMLRDIMVKNFNCFVNRRIFTSGEPLDHALTALKDDQWRHVRNTVSPTFSSGKLKRMSLLVEGTAKSLTSNLREASRKGEEVDLKNIMSCFSMDVIASTGFGVSVDSLNDGSCQFVKEAKKLTKVGEGLVAILLLFPFMIKLMSKMGYGLFSKESSQFFSSFLDAAMENRSGGSGNETRNRHDFIQLMVDEENTNRTESAGTENGAENADQEKNKGLTRLEIQGQAIVFILAAYDTVSDALSFVLFLLAHNPDICAQIQEELDRVLDGKFPTYETVNDLTYLDKCLNESLRMYPPGFIVDRVCTQDCVIQGVKVPKDMLVVIPFIGIYNDPQYFPSPETFDPERFTPENKTSRHPFAFLPFGQGPRNCIGMRLALLETKIAMAAILQEMTPVPCSKTVYPPKLAKYQLRAEDGLWIKFVSRKDQ